MPVPPVPVLDTTRLHAERAVELALAPGDRTAMSSYSC
jgi:hypothetical protein